MKLLILTLLVTSCGDDLDFVKTKQTVLAQDQPLEYVTESTQTETKEQVEEVTEQEEVWPVLDRYWRNRMERHPPHPKYVEAKKYQFSDFDRYDRLYTEAYQEESDRRDRVCAKRWRTIDQPNRMTVCGTPYFFPWQEPPTLLYENGEIVGRSIQNTKMHGKITIDQFQQLTETGVCAEWSPDIKETYQYCFPTPHRPYYFANPALYQRYDNKWQWHYPIVQPPEHEIECQLENNSRLCYQHLDGRLYSEYQFTNQQGLRYCYATKIPGYRNCPTSEYIHTNRLPPSPDY